jgi:hypothetical protein
MDSKNAAKHDTKSGYICTREPYCVFTIVNRNNVMNRYHANIATTAAVPGNSGNNVRFSFGLRPGRPAGRLGGIRSSGQYCCQQGLTGTGTQMTARRSVRGRTAIDGMCP